MREPRSVTLSVTWRPLRYPVMWVERDEDIPPWDVAQGAEPPSAFSRGFDFFKSWLPSFEVWSNLPEKEKSAFLDQAKGGLYGADLTSRYGPYKRSSVFEFLPQQGPRPPEFTPPQHLPRLVRAWPGLSDAVLPLQEHALIPGQAYLPEKQWARQQHVRRKIAGLEKHVRDAAKLQAEIVAVVHATALLRPAWGDSLQDWIEAIALMRLCEAMQYVERPSGEKDWSPGEARSVIKGIVEGEIARHGDVKRPHTWSDYCRALNHSAQPLFQAAGHEARDFVELRQLIVKALHGMVGAEFSFNAVGPALNCGAFAWACLGAAQALESVRLQTCQVCGRKFRGRADSKTCSAGCRQALSRKNRRLQ